MSLQNVPVLHTFVFRPKFQQNEIFKWRVEADLYETRAWQ